MQIVPTQGRLTDRVIMDYATASQKGKPFLSKVRSAVQIRMPSVFAAGKDMHAEAGSRSMEL